MIDFYFQAKGRVSRKQFWLKFFLPYLAVSLAAGVVKGLLDAIEPIAGVAWNGAITFVGTYASVCVYAKRFHDRNMSGWWALWFMLLIGVPAATGFISYFVPGTFGPNALGMTAMAAFTFAGLAALVQLVIVGLLPGTKGPNKYGADPLDPNGVESVEDVFS